MRRAALAAALAVALAGCPIPQPLPDYPAGTITPPRILVDELLGDGAVTFIPAGCTTLAPKSLSAQVVDTITSETIEARWFVNYDYRNSNWSRIQHRDPIPPNGDPTNLTRDVPPFEFSPYDYPPPYGMPSLQGPPWTDAGVVRVVELVVSNGFDPAMDDTVAQGANRSPLRLPGVTKFETSYHRWVFLTSSAIPCP
jgi:hypothetical protein